jgi:hypothetical protein
MLSQNCKIASEMSLGRGDAENHAVSAIETGLGVRTKLEAHVFLLTEELNLINQVSPGSSRR